jgi:hypothetical protein
LRFSFIEVLDDVPKLPEDYKYRIVMETMTMLTPKTSATRHAVIDSWLRRLQEAYVDYQNAARHYNRLLKQQPDGTPSNPKSVLALARQAESEALAEYTRILRAFGELTLQGDVPEEQSAASSNSL